MAWSTRELAELAGTTVNTVRHYHRLGLLAQPERRSNGYKEYGARHLVRLLRIRRLADLGVPLSQLDDVGNGADTQSAAEILLELDAELAQQMARLQKARDDIATILRDRTPLDVPPGFESLSDRLSDANRSLLQIYTRLYDAEALDDLREMVEADALDTSVAFDALTDEADEETRAALAELLAVDIARNLDDYPWLSAPQDHLSLSEEAARRTFITAAVELYNTAQQEVLVRASVRAQELRAPRAEGDG